MDAREEGSKMRCRVADRMLAVLGRRNLSPLQRRIVRIDRAGEAEHAGTWRTLRRALNPRPRCDISSCEASYTDCKIWTTYPNPARVAFGLVVAR
jgi:hypothetical protein